MELYPKVDRNPTLPIRRFIQDRLTGHFSTLRVHVISSIFSTIDNSLMSNIQKLFSERIEIFSAVEFSKVSVLTGIIKISLKVILNCKYYDFLKVI